MLWPLIKFLLLKFCGVKKKKESYEIVIWKFCCIWVVWHFLNFENCYDISMMFYRFTCNLKWFQNIAWMTFIFLISGVIPQIEDNPQWCDEMLFMSNFPFGSKGSGWVHFSGLRRFTCDLSASGLGLDWSNFLDKPS